MKVMADLIIVVVFINQLIGPPLYKASLRLSGEAYIDRIGGAQLLTSRGRRRRSRCARWRGRCAPGRAARAWRRWCPADADEARERGRAEPARAPRGRRGGAARRSGGAASIPFISMLEDDQSNYDACQLVASLGTRRASCSRSTAGSPVQRHRRARGRPDLARDGIARRSSLDAERDHAAAQRPAGRGGARRGRHGHGELVIGTCGCRSAGLEVFGSCVAPRPFDTPVRRRAHARRPGLAYSPKSPRSRGGSCSPSTRRRQADQGGARRLDSRLPPKTCSNTRTDLRGARDQRLQPVLTERLRSAGCAPLAPFSRRGSLGPNRPFGRGAPTRGWPIFNTPTRAGRS